MGFISPDTQGKRHTKYNYYNRKRKQKKVDLSRKKLAQLVTAACSRRHKKKCDVGSLDDLSDISGDCIDLMDRLHVHHSLTDSGFICLHPSSQGFEK